MFSHTISEQSLTAVECSSSDKSPGEATADLHQEAVERVIGALWQRSGRNLQLNEMARIAYISPFHFNRIFHRITGVPPRVFQCAVRLEQAKRMLLDSDMSVLDVCYEVGYNSLGTFTRRFTEFVGLPPGSFRRYANGLGTKSPERSFTPQAEERVASSRGVSGSVDVPVAHASLVFIGLFSGAVGHGRPVACSVLKGTSHFRLADVPCGKYVLAGAAMEIGPAVLNSLLRAPSFVDQSPIEVTSAGVVGRTGLRLRTLRATDPPILLSISTLFAGLNRNRPDEDDGPKSSVLEEVAISVGA